METERHGNRCWGEMAEGGRHSYTAPRPQSSDVVRGVGVYGVGRFIDTFPRVRILPLGQYTFA